MRGWDGYDLLFEELHGLGYRTREVVLDASDFGVPQARRRVFILCDLQQDPPEVISHSRRVACLQRPCEAGQVRIAPAVQ
jgi:DNA (cytosine-5)-methyltransferase 1